MTNAERVEALTYHIRKRQPRRGGNQFYRDRSVVKAETMCGDQPGMYDVYWTQHAAAWTRPDGVEFVPCGRCVEIKETRP